MAKIDYDEIRRIHRLEKSSTQLAELSDNFYSELSDFISAEKKRYLDSLKSLSSSKARDFTNLKRLVEEIFSLREKKMLNKALVSLRTDEVLEQNLTLPEKKAFHEILSTLKRHNALLEGMFSSDSSKAKAEKGLNTLSVTILSDIQAFVGSDMNEYGPYKKDDAVELPFSVSEFLISRKLAKQSE